MFHQSDEDDPPGFDLGPLMHEISRPFDPDEDQDSDNGEVTGINLLWAYMADLQSRPMLSRERTVALANELADTIDKMVRLLITSNQATPLVNLLIRVIAECDNRANNRAWKECLRHDPNESNLEAKRRKLRLGAEEVVSLLTGPKYQKASVQNKAAKAICALGLKHDLIITTAHIPTGNPDLDRQLAQTVEDFVAIRNQIVEGHLRLVIWTAGFFKCPQVELEDLIEEGNIGLMMAAERWDPNLKQSATFSTYASFWIKQTILRYLMSNASPVARIPVYQADSLWKNRAALESLQQKLGREPDYDEVVEIIGTTWRTKWGILLLLCNNHVNLDEPELPSEILESLHTEDLPPQNLVEYSLLRDTIDKILETLTPREEQVLRLSFGLGRHSTPRTLEQVGKIIGVSRERVRQIETKALNKIRHPSRRRRLVEFTNALPFSH